MFKANFEDVINGDEITLYSILCHHLTGDTYDVIRAYSFICDSILFIEAMDRIKNRFRKKVSVIRAHKKKNCLCVSG